jgi:hypothetical protein
VVLAGEMQIHPTMLPLSPNDVRQAARHVPEVVEQERQLHDVLLALGADPDQLMVLKGEGHLMKILASEVDDPEAKQSREVLAKLLGWHERRLNEVLASCGLPMLGE